MRGLHENVYIQDTICSGLGAIERLAGGLYRFWFYIEQTDDDGRVEKLVVNKLVMPASAVPDGILQTIAATEEKAVPLVLPDLVN